MNAASSAYSLSVGRVVRLLLPFDESTNSGNQADIQDSCADSSSSGVMPAEAIRQLRPHAVSLRSLIRVKMADEADVKQVLLLAFGYVLSLIGLFDTGARCLSAIKNVL